MIFMMNTYNNKIPVRPKESSCFFNKVFNNTDHDHIGIVLENYDDYIITAEENVENVSRILERRKDNHLIDRRNDNEIYSDN